MGTAYSLNAFTNVFPAPVTQPRNPTTQDKKYKLGQIWINEDTGTIFGLSRLEASGADWEILGGSSSDVNTISGDIGTATPVDGDIQFVGGPLYNYVTFGNIVTLSYQNYAFPATPYVVGAGGGYGGYLTIQAAINAANADSGGTVIVQPGTYAENLTMYPGVRVLGLNPLTTIIQGFITPSATGIQEVSDVTIQAATNIVGDATAGTGSLSFRNCYFEVTNGTAFSLPNWQGSITIDNCTYLSGTDNVIVANSALCTVVIKNSTLGTSATAAALGAVTQIVNSSFNCPVTFNGAATVFDTTFADTVTFDTSASVQMVGGAIGSSSEAILMSSGNACQVRNTVIDSSNSPAINGGGAGSLTLDNLNFVDNKEISGSLTIDETTTVNAGAFKTTRLTNNIQMSASTITAAGSNTDVTINAAPKGAGNFRVQTGHFEVNEAGKGVILGGGSFVIDGTGDPNTVVTAPQGSLYLRIDGSSTSTRAYINTDGATAWTSITTAS